MAKLNLAIPKQQIEFVRDRVANILYDELSNQYLYTYNKLFEDVNVALEGKNPYIDKTELPIVNVSYVKANYSNKHQGQADGKYQIIVEPYCSAPSSATESGDVKATFDVQYLLGVCRYILEDPVYKHLGFAPGFIKRTFVSESVIYEAKKDDALSTVGARLLFEVEVVETNDLIVPKLADGYDTIVKLGLTDKGYIWSTIQYS